MEKKYKHSIQWDMAGINEPPKEKEIKQTLATIQDSAFSNNAFGISVTEGMYKYLQTNLGDAYIKLVNRYEHHINCCELVIGVDKATVEDFIRCRVVQSGYIKKTKQ